MTQQPVFSICVPSFNRGRIALNMVETVLPQLDDDWELLLLDNASDPQHAEYYDAIRRMADCDPRLRYVRHEANRLFQGNYLACFEMAAAQYFMVISDEDFANPDMIRKYLPTLASQSNLAILRGSMTAMPGVTPRNSHIREQSTFAAGNEALSHFSLANNYVSGTIYNRELAARNGLIERLAKGLHKNRVYPHLYMDILLCARGDVMTVPDQACFEGAEEITTGGDPILGVCRGPSRYNPPYSFGSRVDQFIVLRDAFREAVALIDGDFDHNLFVKLYLRLCEKYLYLISIINGPMYLDHKLHPALLQQSMLYVCGAAISLYPELQQVDTQIFEAIQRIHAKYQA